MKKTDDFEKKDYKKLPKDIKDVVTVKPDIIVKKAKLTFDGKQYIVRIPTEIAKLMNITTHDRIEFNAIIPTPKSTEKKELKMGLMKR